MSPIIVTFVLILLCLHVVSIVISYGLIYACLQRREIEHARKHMLGHMWRAALYSLGGVFTIMQLLVVVRFPKYGCKFFPYETKFGGDYWLDKELEQSELLQHRVAQARVRSNHTTGRCKSIW